MQAAAEQGPFAGRYHDGQTARERKVAVRTASRGLILTLEEDGSLIQWEWAGLQLAGPVRNRQPVRLSHRARPGARLSIDDGRFAEVLPVLAPGLIVNRSGAAGVVKLAALTVLLLAIIGVGLSFVPRFTASAVLLMPEDWDRALGRVAVAQIEGMLPRGRQSYCTNLSGQAALNRLTERLALHVDTPYAFNVRVAEADIVNAVAAPGGAIVFFSPLIEKARSPEEVAGVLAHEMAHVAQRHSTQAVVQDIGIGVALMLIAGIDGGKLAGLGGQAVRSAYSREAEAEADRLAIAYLNAAGIDGTGLADFFRWMDEESGSFDVPGLGYLASHPDMAARIAAISGLATANGPAMSDAEWEDLKAICQSTGGMVSGARAGLQTE